MNEISSMNLLSTLSHIRCVLNVNGHMTFRKYIININMSIFELNNMQQKLFTSEIINKKISIDIFFKKNVEKSIKTYTCNCFGQSIKLKQL